MQFIKKQWITLVAVLVLIIVIVIGWYYFAKVRTQLVPVNPNDSIAAWSFKGIYTNNDALVSKANADIAKLTGMLGKGEYSDYDLYVGLAQDYDLLGDGQSEYAYLQKAISSSIKNGIAWNNLGDLMTKLGAFSSARDAYAKAVASEPTVGMYQESQLRFLITYFPQDTVAIEDTFNNGIKESSDANLLPIEAEWLTSTGSTTAAIDAWKKFAAYVPAHSQQQDAINQKIAQLQNKK